MRTRAVTVRAGVAPCEGRTGLRFPARGRYIVPDAPARVARDRVRYEEATVWTRRPVPRARGRA